MSKTPFPRAATTQDRLRGPRVSSAPAPRGLSRLPPVLGMGCAAALIAGAVWTGVLSHRAVQRDEDMLTRYRSRFSLASAETLREEAGRSGAVLAVADGEPRYLFHIRREPGPWNCAGAEVSVAVSAGDPPRRIHRQTVPVDCR